MFTGIVERVGRVRSVEDRSTTRSFVIGCGALAEELGLGASVAVDGACFTVAERVDEGFRVEVIGTSLARTIAGGYAPGTTVNLERALRVSDRLDGHIVQGHIDGVGQLRAVDEDGEFWRMSFSLPDDVARLTVPRGSIALNGVSLTVAEMPTATSCVVGLIPHTYEHTNLRDLDPGDPVNVEGDLIGKYVGKFIAARAGSSTA